MAWWSRPGNKHPEKVFKKKIRGFVVYDFELGDYRIVPDRLIGARLV